MCHTLPAGIEFCESDGPLALDTPSATPNDPDYPQQLDMKSIGMPAAWATGQFGSPQVRPPVYASPPSVPHPALLALVSASELAGATCAGQGVHHRHAHQVHAPGPGHHAPTYED